MEIRPPQKPNYPGIAGMLEAAFKRPWDLEALANAVMADEFYDPNLVLVAREKGETLGFLHAAIVEKTAWVKLIAVHPSRQRQGLGREMLERMEERVHGEGALSIAAGFSPPPQFFPGVPQGHESFFERLGYAKAPGGSMGRLRAGGPGTAPPAPILIKEAFPAWWGWAEERHSFPDPRLRLSQDGKAACFWEPGKIGPLLEKGAPESSLKEAVAAAASAAGGEAEYSDSRPEAWWRERFEVLQSVPCFSMKKNF